MMSSLLRLRLEYDCEDLGAPTTLVAKFECDDEFRRSVAQRMHFYEREVFFYERLADSVSFRVPQCFHVSFDAGAAEPLLLLEDLGDSATDQTAGCPWDQVELVVDEIAGFHAKWWGGTRSLERSVVTIDDPEIGRAHV